MSHAAHLGKVFLAATLLWLLANAEPAQAGESYYLLMFSYQRANYSPNHAHTFATFVKVQWDGPGPCPIKGATVEEHTISWLPKDLEIRLTRLRAEEGHNFSLHETLRVAVAEKNTISLWGPYPIERELYCKALDRKRHLESGKVCYKANDTGHDTDRITNCIHAVSGVVGGFPVCVGSPGWGDTASYTVLRRMRPWILDRSRCDFWLALALGLDAYPIIYRDGRPIGTGIVLGPLNSVLGRDRELVPTYGPPR